MAVCILCTKQGRGNSSWFLLVENYCQEKLRVLRWESHLAAQPNVHPACSADHVLELVVHWMTTGSLDYPFARFGPNQPREFRNEKRGSAEDGPADRSARASLLGELSIDRASVKRILAENPECLHAVLAALLEALEPAAGVKETGRERWGEELHLITHRA